MFLRYAAMKHPVRRRLMYLGFQGLRALAQSVPLATARAFGRILGACAYRCLGLQRRLTQEHLRIAFGEGVGTAERSRIARRVFANLGQTFMEWLHLSAVSAASLQALITCDGLEHLRQALGQGNGAFLLTAHFGNWEMIPLYLGGLGFKGGVLARRLRYPEYESFLIDLRGARGIPTLARGSLKEVAGLLRANQIVGMLPDQDMDSLEGMFVDFFGRPAHTPVGPAALSLMSGAPMLPCFLIRDGAGFRLVIEPPVAKPATRDRTEAIAALTQGWSRVVESYIRRYPDHWMWMHRRWKTRPGLPEGSRQPAVGSRQNADSAQAARLVTALLLLTAYCLLPPVLSGCGGSGKSSSASTSPPVQISGATPDPNADQQMSGFTLTGYEVSGAKRWTLEGQGASVEDDIVTIHRPNAVGYDPERTAYLTATAAQMRQKDRHVRMEHDVTIHTSDGLWLTTPVLHWIPDQNQVATDLPVRIETDHMLLRGRGARGLTQLKQATIFEDVELVLNPADHDPAEASSHVRITCDGPLAFDYEQDIATFEQNVHVEDLNGDLYSDTLIAYLNRASHTIRYAEAIGRVRIHQAHNTAMGERAVYEPAVGKITLVGKPSLLIYPEDHGGSTQFSFGGLTPQPQEAAQPAVVASR